MTSRIKGASRSQADFRAPARLAYGLVLVAFGGLGAWAAYAPLDSAAIAPGQIEVESRRKVIQHLEGGIIKDILVKEAERVKEGQVLFRLEPIQARASVDMLRQQLDTALAQEARLAAERDGSTAIVFPDELSSRPQAASARADQERQFLERRQSVDNQARMLETRLEQLREQLTGRTRQEESLASQVESLGSELSAVAPLVAKGWYAKNKFLALQREKTKHEGELGQARAEGAKLAKQQEEVQIQIEQLRQEVPRGRRARARRCPQPSRRLAGKAHGGRRRAHPHRGAGAHRGDRAEPAGDRRERRDQGRRATRRPRARQQRDRPRRPGFHARHRQRRPRAEGGGAVHGLSSRRTPTIWGKVESLTADALVNDLSKQPYYRARVIIERASLPATVAAKLIPGMPADVFITTGERSVLDYIAGPLLNAIARGMREE